MFKTSYTNSIKKKAVQEVVFRDAMKRKFRKVVGLAGPNITDYLSFLKGKGIKEAEIYEKDCRQLVNQFIDFSPIISTSVQFGDIISADSTDKKTLYDLDFCCTIKNAKQHIRKFKSNAIITLAIRGVGLKSTVKQFCKLVSKEKPKVEWNKTSTTMYKVHTISFSDQSYTCYQYRDTSCMLTIKPNF